MARTYREDIDWLRAIAVLAVVGFHFEVRGIWGGYVGVDIFFVISGFLISGIICSELSANAFSFARFYERRVRRLLPALYAMLVLTIPPTFIFLLGSERAEFFRSAAAVVTFTSNFFFWFQSGYFDHAAVEKPLLHTWSLAVEEQFYLVLPAILVLASATRLGRRRTPILFAALAAASFAADVWLVSADRWATAFYVSPLRAWEFLIGGLVATVRLPILKGARAIALARGVAIVLLAVPVFGLRKESSFPGLNALLPCLGAAVFIWGGAGAPVEKAYRLLKPLTFFGKISYSLYLWHWPLYTFARFSKTSLVLDPSDKALLFAFTVLVSYLSWRYVEQPFRGSEIISSRRGAYATAASASAALLLACAAGLSIPVSVDPRTARFEAYERTVPGALYGLGTCFGPAGGRFPEACLALAGDRPNVLLWGDSFAAHYAPGLRELIGQERLLQATMPGCIPTLRPEGQNVSSCRSFAEQMRDFFRDHRPDVVIISGDWLEGARRFDAMMSGLDNVIGQLGELRIRVIVLGPSIQFRGRLPAMLLRAHLRGAALRPDDFVFTDIFELDRRMRAALPSHEDFSYVSALDAACPMRQCPLTVGDDVPLAFDHAHLTADGSRYVAAKLLPGLGLRESRM